MDDAIDDAVREMMHRDPRPGIRRRVLAKINEPSRRVSWPGLLVPAMGMLACVLLAVVLFNRRSEPSDISAAPVAQVAANRPSPSQAPAVVARPAPGAAEAPRHVERRTTANASTIFGPRSSRVTAASVPTSANADVAPAAAPTPEIAASIVEATAPPPLVISAIEIQPLQLPALAPRR